MSTRATYKIKSGLSTTTFYIHHDGYFQGAASYFKATMDLMEDSDRPLLACFLWANDGAEPTEGHDVHGDTEYRYDIERLSGKWCVTAYKRESYNFTREWHGNLSDFVSEFGKRRPR